MGINDVLDKIGGWKGAAALGGGIAGIIGLGGNNQQKVGYQGKIPEYQAVQQQVPYETMNPEGRRPGEYGRRYFTDMVYAEKPQGEQNAPTLQQAQDFTSQQIADILAGQTNRGGSTPVFRQDPLPEQPQQGTLEDALIGLALAGYGQTDPSSPTTGGSTSLPIGNSPDEELTLGGAPSTPGTQDTVNDELYTTPVWHYNENNELVRAVPTGTVYKVHVGDGVFEHYLNEDKARERYAEVSQTGFAQGGIASVGAPKGYYLGGPTDGMADEVPATIEGKQEARLSDGEFVIPADVVGHLGNGNSNAGAQQLFSMMDRIRAARTGTKEQGPPVEPKTFLPR